MNLGLQPTHIAFADESHHNVGRYRGVALVSMAIDVAPLINDRLISNLNTSNVRELSWHDLKSARMRFAAHKFIDTAIAAISDGSMRIDVLTWDTEDSRHAIRNRDDNQNLGRMYFRVCSNVFESRWPNDCVWHLAPDEFMALDWDDLRSYLDLRSTATRYTMKPNSRQLDKIWLERKFQVSDVEPCSSSTTPFVQLADLFVGAGVYSRDHHERIALWKSAQRSTNGTGRSLSSIDGLSASDRERCSVIEHLDQSCRAKSVGAPLSTSGLRTFSPTRKLNFWWYTPQGSYDKAPTKAA